MIVCVMTVSNFVIPVFISANGFLLMSSKVNWPGEFPCPNFVSYSVNNVFRFALSWVSCCNAALAATGLSIRFLVFS